MKKILCQNLAFIIPYLFFLLLAGVFLSLYSKSEAHLIINQYRFNFCDYFFKYATYLGDGIVVLCIIFFLCFIKYRYAILVAVSNIISSLITQTLKYTFFSDMVRPVKFFEGIKQLNLVPGVENYSYNSFPSGHTTAAFATFFCLALIMKNRTLKFLMFVIALIVGISRVYLSQHFLSDVYVGSLIGTFTSFFVYVFLSERMETIEWMEKAIIKRKFLLL
jgi:membrane-associated phospholipid phosphatase